MSNPTFEQALMNDVIRQVMTPEKLAAMADRMAPKIEKAFEEAVTNAVGDFLTDSDILYDILYSTQVKNHIRDAVVRSLGIAPQTGSKRTR